MANRMYFPAPQNVATEEQLLTKPQIKQLLNVAGISGRTPARDKALLLCSLTMGLRVTEISLLEVQHIIDSNGKYRVEGRIPGKYTKSGKFGQIFPVNKKFKAALDEYFEWRKSKKHILSDNPNLYRGFRPDSKVFLTETGRKFSLNAKKRMVGPKGNKIEKTYYASDVLERAFKRFYERAFGKETKFSSHSGRKYFGNAALKVIQQKTVENAELEDMVKLLRHHDITSSQVYLVPTKKEWVRACENVL